MEVQLLYLDTRLLYYAIFPGRLGERQAHPAHVATFEPCTVCPREQQLAVTPSYTRANAPET